MFKHFYKFLDKIKSHLSQKGQGMVEYALIIAFVAGIAAVALNSDLGGKVKDAFSFAGEQIDSAKQVNNNDGGGTQQGGT